MKYKELIERFKKYEDEEVSMVLCIDEVIFFPLSDGDTEIVALRSEHEEPFKAYEIEH